MTEAYRRIRHPAGSIVFSEGDSGDSAYIIESGEIEVFVGPVAGLRSIALLGPGEVLGEMAILDHLPRSASARAVNDCTLIALSRREFEQALDRSDPMMRMVLRVMLRRLRAMLNETGVANPADPDSRDAAAFQQILLLSEIRAGLESGQFELHYQPIIDLGRGGRIKGFEALIRWNHPTRGLIYPGSFIPVVEATDFIIQLGLWAVLEAATAQRRLQQVWTDRHDGGLLTMAVNLSAREFSCPDFVAELTRPGGAFVQAGHSAQPMLLEMTERTLMQASAESERIMGELTRHGFRLAVDDFGTGYSSLGSLATWPLHVLKIDRSFINSMVSERHSLEVVRAVVQIAKALELQIVAEGIEADAEAALLARMGVDYGQGWLFGKAVPFAQAEALVAAGRPLWQRPNTAALQHSAERVTV